MGSALAKQMRSPSETGCMGWMAQKIMSSGKGADSIHAVSALTTVKSSPTVVELGPGVGYGLKQMMSTFQPSRVYAIEISSAFRKALTTDGELRASIEGGILTVHGNDAKNLDFIPDNSVDLVFAFNVIYFLDPLEDYAKELYRIVKPGGQLFFGVKDMAKKMDSSIYINNDWDACLKTLNSVGFVEATKGAEQLEGPLAYIPLTAKKSS